MARRQRERLFDEAGPARHGPRGVRVGDLIVADGSRWVVEAIDTGKREAIARLASGSHARRRFRARAIADVLRPQESTP